MRRADQIGAVLLLLFGVGYAAIAVKSYTYWGASGPGSGFFPFWLGVTMAVLATIFLVGATRQRRVGRAFQTVLHRRRIDRLADYNNRRPSARAVQKMTEERDRLRKAMDDYTELLGGDTTYMDVVSDGGVKFMRELLSDPVYGRHLAARGRRQSVLIGYSDSNEQDGPCASRFASSTRGTRRRSRCSRSASAT